MLVLGVDTSWKHGTIALLRDGKALGTAPLEGGTFSAQLVPQIARLLSENKIAKTDLDGFSVVSGPGSFTGLRVGLAAIKALAEILHKPIAASTVLEAMALGHGDAGKFAAVMDAGRGEVFLGEYEVGRRGQTLRAATLRELVVARAEAAVLLQSLTVISCEPAITAMLREAGLSPMEVPRPDAAAIARIGAEKIAAGDTVSPEHLDANYIRRSDAEIFATPKG